MRMGWCGEGVFETRPYLIVQEDELPFRAHCTCVYK